mgnify:CR=1 FL=1
MLVGRNDLNPLEVETYTYGGARKEGQETVIIALAPAEAVTFGIKGDTWDECNVDGGKVGERLSDGLHDMEGTLGKAVRAGIAAEFQPTLPCYNRQQDGLACSNEVIEDTVGVHFVRQRVIGQNNLGICQQGLQPLNDRQRLLLQLLRSELSLYLPDLPSQFRLKHRQ